MIHRVAAASWGLRAACGIYSLCVTQGHGSCSQHPRKCSSYVVLKLALKLNQNKTIWSKYCEHSALILSFQLGVLSVPNLSTFWLFCAIKRLYSLLDLVSLSGGKLHCFVGCAGERRGLFRDDGVQIICSLSGQVFRAGMGVCLALSHLHPR